MWQTVQITCRHCQRGVWVHYRLTPKGRIKKEDHYCPKCGKVVDLTGAW
uniref:Uncharacterized protein n=1 Tax=viral metagenome TaxID=1070528 RepID=A0A6M3JF23_9ZZZZ